MWTACMQLLGTCRIVLALCSFCLGRASRQLSLRGIQRGLCAARPAGPATYHHQAAARLLNLSCELADLQCTLQQ